MTPGVQTEDISRRQSSQTFRHARLYLRNDTPSEKNLDQRLGPKKQDLELEPRWLPFIAVQSRVASSEATRGSEAATRHRERRTGSESKGYIRE